MLYPEVHWPEAEIAAFCRKWRIRSLAVFGSALREDFCATSDLDLLVDFTPDADWRLADMLAMEEEIARIVRRPVDLVTRRAVEQTRNRLGREAILQSAETLYAS